MGDVISFTKSQEDKISVYECIVGEEVKEEAVGGYFYRWYTLESALVETDHTARLSAEVENMIPTVSVASLAFVTLAEAGQIDDATAVEHAAQFGTWAQPVTYKAGAIRLYGGRLYRCIQAHTSQEGWEPPEAVSLWSEIADPSEEWPAWSQPIGAHDAYSAGDKVSHAGKKWTSALDSNVWEPGVYGWTETAEEV